MKIGSLFSGIGGLELGLERAGLGRTVWQVEQNAFCLKVLAKHWPDAQRFDDVRTVGAANLSRVDLLCGGFPCQDVSQAARGRNKGLSGEKSGLWYEAARIIGEIKPTICVVENVANGRARWLPTVRRNLHVLGYRTRAFAIQATEVGAPHLRKRIFVVAYPNRNSESAFPIHAQVTRSNTDAKAMWNGWHAEPTTFRMAHGIPGQMDRVEALGNAVVPQCAEIGQLSPSVFLQ